MLLPGSLCGSARDKAQGATMAAATIVAAYPERVRNGPSTVIAARRLRVVFRVRITRFLAHLNPKPAPIRLIAG